MDNKGDFKKVNNENTKDSPNEISDEKLKENSKENIENTQDTINNNNQIKENKSKIKTILVTLFIIVFSIGISIYLRGTYLEYLDLGTNFVNVFKTNLAYYIGTFLVSFVLSYICIINVNSKIKATISKFFEKENKKMPKLVNKSIAFVISTLIASIISFFYSNNILLFVNSTSFGKEDIIFHMDFSYYVFQRPLILEILKLLIYYSIGMILYQILYYIVLFNKYFDGIDLATLKDSKLLKTLRNLIILTSIIIFVYFVFSSQNILYETITKTKDNVSLLGAGYVSSTIGLVLKLGFSFVFLISMIKFSNYIKNAEIKNSLKPLLAIPIYLVLSFVVIIGYDFIFVKSKVLDIQSKYIDENIKNTRESYGIKIPSTQLEYSGTITKDQIDQNSQTIDNIPLINKNQVLESLKDSQSEKGYFKYDSATLESYKINGVDKLVYVAPRSIKSSGRTTNNKMYEYTHGYGLILVEPNKIAQNGRIMNIQKSFDGSDNVIPISRYQTYYANDINDTVATKTKNKKEYDYTTSDGNDITSEYAGKSGLKLNFLDRFILAIKKMDLKIAFNSQMTSQSKILINKNIIIRAKKVLPDLIYDSTPYPVITDDGRIVYVLDCYTYTDKIPYSQYTTVEKNNRKTKLNYIKNSIKVIIDSYDGDLKFYVTDRNDPIAMAYYKMYPDLFVDNDQNTQEDISSHFIYPKYLYDIQANMLNIYHSTKPDIVYRADDLWEHAKVSNSKSSNQLGSYYTMVNPSGSKSPYLGLVQLFEPAEKRNIISYMIGSTSDGQNVLQIYEFAMDQNVLGPAQINLQLSSDESIQEELDSLNKTGIRLTDNFIAVPIDNTIIYVKAIFQNFLNEKEAPMLKKVIVASGSKVAIGNSLSSAIENLLSTQATDIKVYDTTTSNGLIEAIIETNNDLEINAANNNYEMFGKDLKKLQGLISELEKVKKEEDKAKNLENKNKEKNSDNEKKENGVNNIISDDINNIIGTYSNSNVIN